MPDGAPPPLRPFGLVLHHDGSWSHDGVPIRNGRLRAAFDRSVRFLPGEGLVVVQLGRFRGRVEVEEAAFFVRDFDPETGEIRLSDGTSELLDPDTLRASPRDGAVLCAVKRRLDPAGVLARFTHAAWAELAAALEGSESAPRLRLAGRSAALPASLLRTRDAAARGD
jgi:hypothetical protein